MVKFRQNNFFGRIHPKPMQRQHQEKRVTVGVAMSGGVDSSVTAKLLKDKGHDVHGFFMALAQPDLELQVDRVSRIADHLEISLTVVDLAAEFESAVLSYFTRSYLHGKTPNPCIICNPRIKFGRLLEEILATGCDFMATGHYARISRSRDHVFHLLKGLDLRKDQSYFLHRLTQEQLARIMMPLGELTKDKVYTLAAELGLAGLHGNESQDVCFLKGTDLQTFMARSSVPDRKEGPILTLAGKEVGRHRGIQYYTVGQRRGLSIPDKTPYYVVALDPANNIVLVGKKNDLLQQRLQVAGVNWLSGSEPALPQDFRTRIRYRHQETPAQVLPAVNNSYPIIFSQPQSAVTPGQFAVFYRGDEVIGGGEILPDTT